MRMNDWVILIKMLILYELKCLPRFYLRDILRIRWIKCILNFCIPDLCGFHEFKKQNKNLFAVELFFYNSHRNF